MIVLKVNSEEIANKLDYLSREQMPFAGARALTWTAQDAQDAVRRELHQRFMLRNNFVSQGIRIQSASKDTLQAKIFTRNDGKFSIDFMVLQETGGQKSPTSSHNISLPVDAKRNKFDIIRQGNRPRALLERNQEYFAGTVKGIKGIWKRPSSKERRGAYANGKAVAGVDLMFRLVKQTSVRARLDFLPTVQKVANERFERNFNLSFKDAIGSAPLASF